jgi:hypothetical protein
MKKTILSDTISQAFSLFGGPALVQALRRRLVRGRGLGRRGLRDACMSDTWIEDCWIASIIVQLPAQSLRLEIYWVQIRELDRADGKPAEVHIWKLLGLSETFSVKYIISIGYTGEKKTGAPKEWLEWDKIRNNRWA